MSEVMMPHRQEIPHLEQQRASVGVLSVIYHPGAQSVLLIREKNSKISTDKKAGQLSFPIETRKHDEEPAKNLLASLAEVFDDKDKAIFGNNLHLSRFYQKMFSLPDNVDVPVDIALFVYDGALIIPTPVTTDEVEAYGWVPIDELASLPLRSITQQALSHLQDEHILYHAERTYLLNQQTRRQLRQQYFSLAEFHSVREQGSDVSIRGNHMS